MGKRPDSQIILNVDLSSREVWKEEINADQLIKFLGGRGIAAKLLWDNTGKDTQPLGEDNVLIFASGTLTGTHAPSSGRTTVSAKGPATNLYLKTSVGGYFGNALKMAGVDYLVIHGASETPVSIYLSNNQVNIRDAGDLWGKGVKNTTKLLEEKHENQDVEVACIGPAGENQVKYASIMISYYNAAARGGIGAVMGSKKLKAVVVNQEGGRVEVANPHKFGKAVIEAREALYKDSLGLDLHKFGTARDVDMLSELRILPSYNFQRGHIEEAENISGRSWPEMGYLKRIVGCGSCIYCCHRFTEVEEGKYKGTYSGGPEYETVASLGSGCGITHPEAVFKANEICNDMGLDTISTGSVIQWAMESFEKGVLTKEDTDGIEFAFGNEEALIKLTEKIAEREGIGDLLAEGTKRASQEIGGDSWKWAIQTRGLEQSRVETRGAYSYALAFAVNPRGPDHLHTECLAEFGGTPEAVKTTEKITGDKKYAVPTTIEKRAEIVRWHEDIYAVSDALGLCAFTTTAAYGIDEEKSADLFKYATGIEMSPDRIMQSGRRIITLERCFNIREGQSRKDDLLPWRIMNERQDDLESEDPIISREKLNTMLDNYYKLHEWDIKTGRPTEETLTKLGLEFVLEELAI